jgi:hypothetical protein
MAGSYYYTRALGNTNGTFTAPTTGVWDITLQGAAGGNAGNNGGLGGNGFSLIISLNITQGDTIGWYLGAPGSDGTGHGGGGGEEPRGS